MFLHSGGNSVLGKTARAMREIPSSINKMAVVVGLERASAFPCMSVITHLHCQQGWSGTPALLQSLVHQAQRVAGVSQRFFLGCTAFAIPSIGWMSHCLAHVPSAQ